MKRHVTPLSYLQFNHVQCTKIPDGQPVVSMALVIPIDLLDRNLTTSEGYSPFFSSTATWVLQGWQGGVVTIDT